LGAVVKLATKPQHGKLTTKRSTAPITQSRFINVGHCYGKPTPAFFVYYTPAPGFRGTDTFGIDINWNFGRHEIDSYSVTVQ
jgi:hypothetical protein